MKKTITPADRIREREEERERERLKEEALNELYADKESDISSDIKSDNVNDIKNDVSSVKTNDNESAITSDIISDIDSAMLKPKKQPKYTDLHERRTHYLTKENVEFIEHLYDKYNQDKSETVNRALMLYKKMLKKPPKNGK
jgi:hypothetical protein